MSPPPRAALAAILAVAACTRSPAPAASAAPAATSARATGAPSPAPLRAPGSPPAATAIRERPAPCLAAEPFAAPSALAEEAFGAIDRGDGARALACAEEALRLAPRLVPALAARAGALSELGRLEDARLAFARALAVDPDAPESLLGAAELYVRRTGSARDALEAGLEYAVRGARAALRPQRHDRELAARLELVAGMAENDLGRSHLALAHLDRAVAARPDDADAVYERGVALYELCRFDEAARALERSLALAPDDAWALHQLGLVAERRGEVHRAETLLAKARRLAPDEFRADLPVDEAAFRAGVEAAIATLPAPDRAALRRVPLELRELPAADDLLAVDPPLSPSILGLFRGPPEEEPCSGSDGPACRVIVLYRKNLIRFARDRKELDEQVRVTLLHELGHLRGEDDDALRDRGLE